MRAWIPICLLLCACGGGTTCDLDALGDGALSGTVDGAVWATDGAAWSDTGAGIQIVTSAGGGYRLTISALTSVEGTAVNQAIAAGSFPIEVDFGDEAAGFALLYPDDGASLTTKGNSGLLTIESVEGGVLGACFDFQASGDTSAAVDGAVRAVAL